jgi:hypothetical protein
MAVEVKEIQQQPIIINNNINITTTNNNNNTTNNIKKVNKTPNYANNVYDNPVSNDKLNKKINKKIKADEKINFLLQMKQLDEDLEKQEIQLIKLQIEKADRDDREEEARIKQLEEDEIKRVKLENENYINKCLNSPEVLRNKQIYRAKKEKEQDDLNNIKDKYNIDFYDKNGKKQVVYQFDDNLKEIYDGIISDVKCYKCKTIKAYPNDYMTKKNKLTTSIFLKNGKEECVCAECVYKKTEQITEYVKNHEIRCKKCLNLYYCNGKDMRIKHEEGENCLKMSKKRKLINGKIYGIMELRSICKLNNIKNYVRMNKIEMINTILSLDKIEIPEGL